MPSKQPHESLYSPWSSERWSYPGCWNTRPATEKLLLLFFFGAVFLSNVTQTTSEWGKKKKNIFVDYKYREKTRYSDLKTQHVCHHVLKLTRDNKGPPLGYCGDLRICAVALVALSPPVGITPQLKCVFEATCQRGCSPCCLAPRSGRGWHLWLRAKGAG